MYAEVFARSKWKTLRWAPRRIRTELGRRGIRGELVDEALEHVFGSEAQVRILDEEDLEVVREEGRLSQDELEDMTRQHGVSRELLEVVRRLAAATSHLAPERRRKRIEGWLARRGYSWDIISQIIKQLEL